jgi:hypothetical protein
MAHLCSRSPHYYLVRIGVQPRLGVNVHVRPTSKQAARPHTEPARSARGAPLSSDLCCGLGVLGLAALSACARPAPSAPLPQPHVPMVLACASGCHANLDAVASGSTEFSAPVLHPSRASQGRLSPAGVAHALALRERLAHEVVPPVLGSPGTTDGGVVILTVHGVSARIEEGVQRRMPEAMSPALRETLAFFDELYAAAIQCRRSPWVDHSDACPQG